MTEPATPAPNRDVERELLFVGGPLDGRAERQPKAFWPVGTYYPDPEGRNAGVWCGQAVPDDPARGRYIQHPERPCRAEPVWMLWIEAVESDSTWIPETYDSADYCGTCGIPLSRHAADCRTGDLL